MREYKDVNSAVKYLLKLLETNHTLERSDLEEVLKDVESMGYDKGYTEGVERTVYGFMENGL